MLLIDGKEDGDSIISTLKDEKNLGRATSIISKEREFIKVEVIAPDATSLRAALNAYLRYIQIFENVGDKDE